MINVIVTMRHVRAAGMCSGGARRIAKERGWDWDGFLEHGISSEILEETGDAMMLKLVEVARAEVTDNG